MLIIELGGKEFYDEKRNMFISPERKIARLEHSLRSVALWESKWNVAFLSSNKTREQNIDYYHFMDTTHQLKREDFEYLLPSQEEEIQKYIELPMTATTINRRGPQRPNRKIITAEVIYAWMVQQGVPFECDKWHLNRLMMLLEVCIAENGPQQKMGRKEAMAQQRALNASRCAKYKTRG